MDVELVQREALLPWRNHLVHPGVPVVIGDLPGHESDSLTTLLREPEVLGDARPEILRRVHRVMSGGRWLLFGPPLCQRDDGRNVGLRGPPDERRGAARALRRRGTQPLPP